MLKTFLWALMVYGVIVAALFLWQRRILYVPTGITGSPAEAGVPSMQEVEIPGPDALTLKSWYSPPAPGKPVILYFQGNAGNISDRAYKAQDLMNWGYGVFLLGYPGYSGNPGWPSEAGLYAAAQAAVAYLEGKGVEKNGIVLYGESLGTGIAVELAAGDTYRAVVLEAPYTSITDIAASTYWFVPVRLLLKDRFENLTKISGLGAPLLVLHGRADRVIPYSHGEKVFDAAPDPKAMKSYDNGGHSDLFDHGAALDVHDFLESHVQ